MPEKSRFNTVALEEQSKELMKRSEQRFFAEVARSFREFHNEGVAIKRAYANQGSQLPSLHFRTPKDRPIGNLSRLPDFTVERSTASIAYRAPYQPIVGCYPLEAQFSPRDDAVASDTRTPRPDEYFSFAQSFPRDGVFDMYAQTWKDDPDLYNQVFYNPLGPDWDPDLPDDYHHRFITIPEVSRENGIYTKSVAAALSVPCILNTSFYSNDRALAGVSADVDLRSFFWFSSTATPATWDFARARLEVRLVVWTGSDLPLRDYLVVNRRGDAANPRGSVENVSDRQPLRVGYVSPFFGNACIAVHGQLMVQVAADSAFTVGCSASSLSSGREGYFRICIPEIRYMYSWPGIEYMIARAHSSQVVP